MSLHSSTYEYLKPLPDGPDKTFIIRAHRANAMWSNVAITRQADGSPRT